MRVLHINTVVNTGSTGRIVEEIGTVLIENGHESIIAYGRNIGHVKSKSKLLKIGNNLNVLWHFVNTFLRDKHGLTKDLSTKNFLNEIDKLKPDLIALYNLHGYYIDVGLLFNYLEKKGVPVVWTLFDCWAFTGHCTYFDNIGCDKWKSQCYDCPKYNKYPRSIIDNSSLNFNLKKRIFNLPHKLEIITHSSWLSKYVRSSFLNSYGLHIIPSAVDVDLFKPIKSNIAAQNGIYNQRIILGCANIWTDRKGLNDFIILSEKCDVETVIVLIGLNKSQMKKLPQNIIGINRTESIEVLVKWYSAASVFVNPTYMDNFPTTNIEALACGTPVVTYNAGGSPESIDANTGRIVQIGNVDGIWESILELGRENEEELTRACRERALNHYNKKTRFLDYLRVFEEII